jgi:hypothetical protein
MRFLDEPELLPGVLTGMVGRRVSLHLPMQQLQPRTGQPQEQAGLQQLAALVVLSSMFKDTNLCCLGRATNVHHSKTARRCFGQPLYVLLAMNLYMTARTTACKFVSQMMLSFLAGYVPKAVLAETNYPLHPNSVPAWSVPLYSLVVPAILMALHSAVLRWAAMTAVLYCILGNCLFVGAAVQPGGASHTHGPAQRGAQVCCDVCRYISFLSQSIVRGCCCAAAAQCLASPLL